MQPEEEQPAEEEMQEEIFTAGYVCFAEDTALLDDVKGKEELGVVKRGSIAYAEVVRQNEEDHSKDWLLITLDTEDLALEDGSFVKGYVQEKDVRIFSVEDTEALLEEIADDDDLRDYKGNLLPAAVYEEKAADENEAKVPVISENNTMAESDGADAEPAENISVNSVEQSDTIIDVWYNRTIEKQNTEITVTTSLEMNTVSMYLGDNCLKTWNDGDEGVTVKDYANYREWQLTYQFEYPGDYNLLYKASAAGEDNAAVSKPVTIKRPAIIDMWYNRTVEKQNTEITVITSLEMNTVSMYLGDDCLKTWNNGDEDVTIKDYANYREWQLTYQFEYPGDYGLWYKASSAGEATIPYSKPVTIKRPAIIDIWYNRTIEKENTEITVITSLEMNTVSMYLGDGCLKTWKNGDADVNVTDNDNYREWQLTYQFEYAGNYDLWYKASATNEENVAFSKPVEIKRPAIIDIWYNRTVEKENTEITVITSLEMNKVSMNLNSDTLKTWNKDDADITVTDYDNYREWQLTYQFDQAGDYDLWYQASAADEATIPVSKPVTITSQTQQEGDFEYRFNADRSGVVIVKYTGSASSVTVPAIIAELPVVEIGEGAFENNTAITSVDLPDTVEVIGKRAFAGCTALNEMN